MFLSFWGVRVWFFFLRLVEVVVGVLEVFLFWGRVIFICKLIYLGSFFLESGGEVFEVVGFS